MKLLLISLLFSSVGYSASFKTEIDGYVLDWSASRLQLTGEALPKDSEQGYAEAEKRAWSNGISKIRKVSEQVYIAHYTSDGVVDDVLKEPSQKAGLRAARAVFSKDTEYVSDGSVNVALEARLSNVLASFGVKHTTEDKPDYKTLLKKTSGVIFNIKCQMEPRADLEISSPSGEPIYAPYLILDLVNELSEFE